MRSRPRRAAGDETRERRLDEVRTTVEEFLFNLAMLVAGHDADFTRCASRTVDRTVRTRLAEFLSTGHIMRPDFGSHGELRVEADLLDTDRLAIACVEFEDRSLLQRGGGRPLALARRRIRISLELSLQPCHVVAFTVRVPDAP